MKTVLSVMAAAVIAAGTAQAVDLDVSGSMGADVVSAYIFRGATVNDEWNVQPFVEAATHGVTAGAWWNWNTDLENFDEVDFYVSWDVPLPEDQPLGLSIGYTNYDFPDYVRDGSVELEGADREIQIGLSADVILQPTLFAGFGVDGPFLDKGIYLALGASHDYEINEKATISGGATLGFELGDNVTNTGASFLQLSLGASYDIIGITFNYIAETDDKVLVVDEDWYVAFSIAI